MSDKAPEEILTVDVLRWPISILLVASVILVAASQFLYLDLVPERRPWLYLLLGTGLGGFALAGHVMFHRRLPAWLLATVARLCYFFSLAGWQLLLLLLAPAFGLLAWLAAGDQLHMTQPLIAWFAWWLALAAGVAGSYRLGESLSWRIERAEVVVLATLFLLALVVRAYALDRIPTTLSGDEGSSGLMAVNFLQGEANNVFTVGWFSFPALYFAVQAVGIWLLGQTVEGLRITSAVAGALTVVAVYLLGRLLFDRLAALLAAAYLMASHYHIHFSRIGLNNIWDGLFVVVTFAAFWYGWRSGRRFPFILAGLVLGLGLYFYVAFRVVPGLLLIWTILAFVWDRAAWRRRLPDIMLTAYLATLVFLPMGLYYWHHPDQFQAPMNRVTIFEGWLQQQAEILDEPEPNIILNQMWTTARGFTHEPLRHWYNPGAPLLLSGAAVLFLMGIAWAIAAFDLRHALLLLPLLATIILGGLSQDAPASQRFVLVIPAVAILVALPLRHLAVLLGQLWPRLARIWVAVAIALMAWLMLVDLNYYFGEVYDDYVLGGVNTEVATEVAHFLQTEAGPDSAVYFFALPRMSYYSHSTIPYLVPYLDGQDVSEPLTAAPEWPAGGPTFFIFLPERLPELAHVRVAFPGGRYREFPARDRSVLFAVYRWPAEAATGH
jgi:4-amino-4-deoxy-L-arabinose transferase-like glycosyltransferase